MCVFLQEAQERWRQASAARAIQGQWRVHQARRDALARIRAARAQRDAAFARLQQHFVQVWPTLPASHRVIVHCPSLTLAPAQRESISHVGSVPVFESAHMSRLCDVADAKTDVVYIAPAPVDAAVEQYWARLLEAGGVAEAASRFRIVHPENYVRLPERLSLTSKLLASPRALRRVKLMVQGRPAFIVPGAIGDAEIDLAVALGMPLLGSHPAITAAVGSKSGARALFRQARMNVAPGCDIAPIEGPLAEAAPGSSGPDGGVLMDFAMRDGELSIRDCGSGVPGRGRAERKDRLLCERLAHMMIEHPLVPVRCTRRSEPKFYAKPWLALVSVGLCACLHAAQAARSCAEVARQARGRGQRPWHRVCGPCHCSGPGRCTGRGR